MLGINTQFWEENQNLLNQHLANGLPHGGLEEILSKAYGMVLITIIIILIIVSKKNYRRIPWKLVMYYVLICTFFGYTWGVFAANISSQGPAWAFLPWAILGVESFLVFEDMIFYPMSALLFYYFYYFIGSRKGVSTDKTKHIVQGIHIGLSLLALFVFETIGISIVFWFTIPSIFLFYYVWDQWIVKHYFIVFIIIIVFATVWDLIGTTYTAQWIDAQWAYQWVYARDSTLFKEDYYIGNSPLAITPWLGIAGAMFSYSLALALNKLVKK